MKTTIIDYGLSNLMSVKRAFECAGAQVEITNDPQMVLAAQSLVLPGVGAFADGMAGLQKNGLIDAVKKKAADGTPLFAICLGMQMLFDESDEFGVSEGLSLISGRVERIPELDRACNRQTVPHIGWSALCPLEGDSFKAPTLRGFPAKGEVYFVHSFEAKPAREKNVAAYCEYGGRKICAAAINDAGNVFGTQFHPEKSGELGIEMINRFLKG